MRSYDDCPKDSDLHYTPTFEQIERMRLDAWRRAYVAWLRDDEVKVELGGAND